MLICILELSLSCMRTGYRFPQNTTEGILGFGLYEMFIFLISQWCFYLLDNINMLVIYTQTHTQLISELDENMRPNATWYE